MKSFILEPLGNMLDISKAREAENQILGENYSDVAEAFRAITSMVVE